MKLGVHSLLIVSPLLLAFHAGKVAVEPLFHLNDAELAKTLALLSHLEGA